MKTVKVSPKKLIDDFRKDFAMSLKKFFSKEIAELKDLGRR